MIRTRAEEFNNVYLNNTLFWAYQLSGEERIFDLRIGDDTVTTVSGILLTVAEYIGDAADREGGGIGPKIGPFALNRPLEEGVDSLVDILDNDSV